MLYFFVFIFGLAVGSFLNVVIFRLEKDKLVLTGRSKCPKCGEILNWRDLVPLVSFFEQRGRCRYCGKKISWQYPAVEMATGLLFLLVILSRQSAEKNLVSLDPSLALRMTPDMLGIIFNLIVVSSLIVIFTYDLKHYIIPDKIVYPAAALVFLARLFGVNPLNYFLSAFFAAGFFLALVLASKGRWMGLGDVKLAFLLGLFLGWPMVLMALFLSFFSGAFVGLLLIMLGRKKMKSEIPFGPFLAGSAALVFLFEPFFQGLWQNLFAF